MNAGSDDWDPETYSRFRGLRLRPALDLLGQVGDLPEGAIVDLGCGNGAIGETLAARWPDRVRIGLDQSPAMLAKAAETGCYTDLIEADLVDWRPELPVALIFSNAALHWLGAHEVLLPRLAGLIAPGGVLAVQMPRQEGAPSHRFLRDIAAAMFALETDAGGTPRVHAAEYYWRLLHPVGEVTAWETEYVQHLDPAPEGHPVRRFTEGTVMRPYLARLLPEQISAFTAAYDEALGAAYPLLPDGSALFPFRRVFFTVQL